MQVQIVPASYNDRGRSSTMSQTLTSSGCESDPEELRQGPGYALPNVHEPAPRLHRLKPLIFPNIGQLLGSGTAGQPECVSDARLILQNVWQYSFTINDPCFLLGFKSLQVICFAL